MWKNSIKCKTETVSFYLPTFICAACGQFVVEIGKLTKGGGAELLDTTTTTTFTEEYSQSKYNYGQTYFNTGCLNKKKDLVNDVSFFCRTYRGSRLHCRYTRNLK